jgi:hypothetical protein
MTDRLNEFLLIRKQFIQTKDMVKNNLKSSTYKVPVVGDDILYGIPNFRGVYSKSFVGHTGGGSTGPIGPDPVLYNKFIKGIKDKNLELINEVCKTCPRLVDVFSLFDLEFYGQHRASYEIPIAPHPLSPEGEAEMLEVYLMALVRDFNVILLDPSDSRYSSLAGSGTGSWTQAKNYLTEKITNLNTFNSSLNYLKAPVNSQGLITPSNLFRGLTKGDLQGPYVSQLFYYSVFPGNLYITQNYLVSDCSFNQIDISNNFNNTKDTFLKIWNGGVGQSKGNFALRYLSTVRDLAIYINKDEVWQPFFVSATFCLDRGIPSGFYCNNRKPGTCRFINLGSVDLWAMMTKACKNAMNAAWVWKWSQLKLRPEEYGYQTHLALNGSPLDFSENYLTNPILLDIINRNGNAILPLAYSMGSPSHPAYPAGHATIAGAMTTILKAWFNGDSLIEAYVPDVSNGLYGGYDSINKLSGTKLQVYKQVSSGNPQGLTGYYRLDDELDKMASNCSYTRAMAGVHYRSDCDGGLLLGEKVAIDILKQEVMKYHDDICFRFRKRDGSIIKISNNTNSVPDISGNNIYFTNPITVSPSKDALIVTPTLYVPNSTTNTSTQVVEPTIAGYTNWASGPSFVRT